MATKKKVTVKDKEREALANQVYENNMEKIAQAALSMTYLQLHLQRESDIE